jgi:hypothetical protein
MAGAFPGDLVVHILDCPEDIVSIKALSGFRGVYRPRSARGAFVFFAPALTERPGPTDSRPDI